MSRVVLPAIWLIVCIVGLPQLSETVYTPSLPDIARALQASESMVEYTLTIYLFGFAVGTLFWGKLSDRLGRKPCVLAGLFIFILGCLGCYLSSSITGLLINRFTQAFGGSIGSVLGQAICRDAFQGSALGKVYASAGSALAIFPALGPIVGGFIAERWGWSPIFLFLIAFAFFLVWMVAWRLPETHHRESRQSVSLKKVGLRLLQDRKVIGFGLIVAACNGISFSYFAEGSFYLIELLGLSPSLYGLSFIGIAGSNMVGGLLSRKLHNYTTSQTIMDYGIRVSFLGSLIFCLLILGESFGELPKSFLIGGTITCQMVLGLGTCMATSNALAMALVDYKECGGTASSLFGFFYYCLISLFTLGMGSLHNGTLWPMPLYFFALASLMRGVRQILLK